MGYMVGFEPRREDYLDDDSFDRVDDDYWSWFESEVQKHERESDGGFGRWNNE